MQSKVFRVFKVPESLCSQALFLSSASDIEVQELNAHGNDTGVTRCSRSAEQDAQRSDSLGVFYYRSEL